MPFTTPPEIDTLLTEILAALQSVLGKKLLGLYLFGSMVSGDFADGISDLDLFALLRSELTTEEFSQLDNAHLEIFNRNPAWENRIEIAYLTQNALATFRTQRSPIAVISPGEPFNIKDAGHDWAINWYILRQDGRALFGPPVKEVFPRISQREFVEFVRTQALEWGDWVVHTRDSPPYQAYAVLTLCRALYAVRTGEQPSKRVAGLWVTELFPQWAELISWSFAMRVGQVKTIVDPEDTYKRVKAFVQFVINEIRIDLK